MSEADFVFDAKSEADTRRLGEALAGALPDGANVALVGTLGAGKTRLVQAVAAALGVTSDEVTSPTFVLINEYHGRREIIHIDAYRLRDEDEWMELGLDEYFESPALVLVEWADKFAELMPADCLEIRIESTGETERRFVIASPSKRHSSVIADLAGSVANDKKV